MSEPVQQRTGEALGAEDLGPSFEGQVGGHTDLDDFIIAFSPYLNGGCRRSFGRSGGRCRQLGC